MQRLASLAVGVLLSARLIRPGRASPLRLVTLVALLMVLTAPPAPGQQVIADAGSAVAGSAAVPAPASVRVEQQPVPQAFAETLIDRPRRRGPQTVKGEQTLVVAEPQAASPAPAGVAGSAPAPQAASTFTQIRVTDLRSALPPDNTSFVGEPCVAQRGRDVLVTGNWYAAVSDDGGISFSHVSPYTAFPPVNQGFCCDQNVAYEPSRDLFIWLLLYVEDGVSNTFRLALAQGQANFEAGNWYYYDFTPQLIGFPNFRSFDYPKLALGTNSLYLTSNVFVTNAGPWAGTAILRIPLDPIAAGANFTFQYYVSTDHFNFTPVSGAGTTMYWGSHDLSFYRTSIYRWTEGADTLFWDDVNVSVYGLATGSCPGPDGLGWCARSDDRIMTGWVAGGVIGFMWNASQDGAHPYPYIRVLRVNESNRSSIDEPNIHNPGYAFQYPAVGVNARGHIAGTLFYGGGPYYPTLANLILDDLSGPLTSGWELYTLAAGNSGPATDKWGDFLCAAANRPHTNTWVGVGYMLKDGNDRPNVHPIYAWVGRERDVPTAACGDGVLDPGEQCDPPGSITCPPGSPAGAFLACNADCTCPTTTTTTTASSTTTTAPPTTTTSTTTTTTTTTTTLPCTSARCALDASRQTPPCADQVVPVSVKGKFDRAASLIEQAGTSPAKQAKKLLRQAKKLLRQAKANAARAAKGRKPKISSACAKALRDAADHAAAGLQI